MTETIYIRADANEEIGTGHIMRCLSVAEKITELGGKVIFIIADYQSYEIIQEKGYKIICINSQWNNLEQEINKMTSLCHKLSIKKLVIDSYFVTKNYLESLKKVTKIIYIDDLDKFIYPVNMLINYNFYASDMCYEDKYNGTLTQLLLGTRYVPLRREFEDITERKFKGINKILITSGGTDKYNMIGIVLGRIIKNPVYKNIDIYCILGRFNINSGKLGQEYGTFPNVHLLNNVSNMEYYMKNCDLCITAGGTTIYELCACGTPSILYSIADNQINVSKKVSSMGIFLWAGDVRSSMDSCLDNIEKSINIFNESIYWTKISHDMQRLVDGKGALRLAREILS